MALHPTRRRFLTGVGLAGTAGTALLSPGRPAGSPDIDPTVSTGTWPLAGRGPARAKHAPDAAPPTTDAEVVWSAAVPLWEENQTLTLDEPTVYAAGADGVTAVDAATGSVRWRFDVTDHWQSEAVDVTAGPAVAGDRVLLVTSVGVLALDAATGRVEWARAVDGQPRHAVLVGDALFLRERGNGAMTVALDAATGGAWYRLETRDFLSPVAFVGGDLVALDSDRLVGVDPRTGERGWQAVNPGTSHLPETAVAGTDRVVVLGSNPLVAVDTDDGTEAWRYEARTGEDEVERFRPATDGERVYVSAYWAGKTMAFDAATGDVVWRVDERLGEPVVAGETVYCGGSDGITALDAATGDRRGRFGADLGPRSGADALVAADDRLYVAFASEGDGGSASALFALEAP